MTRSFKLMWFVLLGLGALGAVGCKEKKSTTTVGFAQVGAESGWRTAETNSIQSEAKTRGINLKFVDGQGKQENQISALRGFIAQGVDAIVLAPIIETGWEPVLTEAKDKKIPVILVDRSVTVDDDSLYTTLICSDFIKEGHMAADWLAKKVNNKANIVQLEGTPASAPANDRAKGFADEIAKHPDMKIIASNTGNFERKGGKDVMEAFLKAHPDITAVYAHNDDMALGAIQAIEAAGKKPGTDIIVVSIDGVHDAFQAMVDGKLNCTVECQPLLGPAAFDAVKKALANEQQPKKTLVKDELFDQSTAKDVIASRKY